jgi:hypothetical protein
MADLINIGHAPNDSNRPASGEYARLLRELSEHCREALRLIEKELCDGACGEWDPGIEVIVDELRITGDAAVRAGRSFRDPCPF